MCGEITYLIHVERERAQRTESRKAKGDEEISAPEKNTKGTNKSHQFTQGLQKGLTGRQSSQLRNSIYICRQMALFKSSIFQQPLSATHTGHAHTLPLPLWKREKKHIKRPRIKNPLLHKNCIRTF